MERAFYGAKGSGNLGGEYTRKQVVAAEPNAVKIVKVDGGWLVFYSVTDYETWRKQK